MTPREKLAAGRIRVFDHMPYLASYVYALKQQAVRGTGTMGVSKDGTLYWDPEFVEAQSIDGLAYCVLHESLHLIFRHHARARAVYGENPTPLQQLVMNVAADLVIEQTMALMRPLRPAAGVFLGAEVPALGMKLDFPPNLDTAKYYRLIMDRLPKQADRYEPTADSGRSLPGDEGRTAKPRERRGQANDGKEGSRKGQSTIAAACAVGAGGSSGDGVERSWEASDESWEAFQEMVAAGTAEEAMKQAELLNPGSVPGQLRETIAQFLRPQPDPFETLRSVVASSAEAPLGGRMSTYRRLSRKQPEHLCRLRGLVTSQASAVVIVDTSGSMNDRETKERALQVIASGLRKLSRVKVVCADTRIRSSQRLHDTRHFEWVGGGGTSMDAALESVDRTDRPDNIVLITDACTDWPARQTRARVVVALTQDSSYRRSIPRWCRVVPLYQPTVG